MQVEGVHRDLEQTGGCSSSTSPSTRLALRLSIIDPNPSFTTQDPTGGEVCIIDARLWGFFAS